MHLTAASQAERTADAVAELREGTGPVQGGVVLVFHSISHDPHEVARIAKEAYPDALCCGCSTMGEIGPAGLTHGGLSAFALGAPARAVARVVTEHERTFNFQRGAQLIDELKAALGVSLDRLSPEQHVLVTLTEGLEGTEERLIASLALAAPRVSLVGGSAGDDFQLQRTWVHLDGQAYPSASLVLLLEPNVPFRAFAVHHYRPDARRVVVTRADPERRLVYELDGWPAPRVLADLLGVSEEVFAADPAFPCRQHQAFAYSVGGELYMRSVMQIVGDALLMGGAVEEGVVLRLMSGDDLVGETRTGLARQVMDLGAEPSAMLLFNCGGRLLLAEAEGCEEALHAAMSEVPSAGFSTYGEQFGPLQVNQTLTGLLLGR